MQCILASYSWCEILWFFSRDLAFDVIYILDEECSTSSRTATRACFIYILDSSNSSSFTFWTSQFTSSSRCNWTDISTDNSNDSWTDKHSSHFSTTNEMSVKATFCLCKSHNMQICCCNLSELVICQWWIDLNSYSRIELVDKREDQKV